MPQIPHFHNFIFEDYWPDCVNDYASRISNFRGTLVICENSKIYIPQKFIQVATVFVSGTVTYGYIDTSCQCRGVVEIGSASDMPHW